MNSAPPLLVWMPSQQRDGEEACWFTHAGTRYYIRRDPVTQRCTHLAREIRGRTGRLDDQPMTLDSQAAREVLAAVGMAAAS